MIFTLTLNPALDWELVVPALRFDEALRATTSRTDLGGKGFNVSRALAALGTGSLALGFVGGPTGQQLERGLDALGIRTDFTRIAGETRTNVSIVAADHSHYVKANEPGPAVSPQEQAELLDRVRARAAPGDWWVLSGSLPPGVPAQFYAKIIGLVQASGGRAVLDTSGDALRLGCEAGAFLVKPNRLEAAALTGVDAPTLPDCAPALKAVHRVGAQRVALSMGRAGAAISDGERAWLAHAPAIEEHNPTGAGDALVAGLVWALDRGYALPDALVWGAACGAAAASLDGTGVGSGALVARLREKVRLEEISG